MPGTVVGAGLGETTRLMRFALTGAHILGKCESKLTRWGMRK